MAAPVCPINRDQFIGAGTPPKFPSIPPATDLPSALRTITVMREIIIMLTNQLKPPVTKLGRWQEVSRVEKRVRVENPNDSDQYVEIDRINQLKMRDTVTGEEWVWNRGASRGG